MVCYGMVKKRVGLGTESVGAEMIVVMMRAGVKL